MSFSPPYETKVCLEQVVEHCLLIQKRQIRTGESPMINQIYKMASLQGTTK